MLRLVCWLLPLLLPFPATALAQEVVRWHGLELDLPAGWSTADADGILLLKPAGWKQGENTGEAYGLLFDDEIKTLEAEDLADTIDGAAEELVDGMRRAGRPVEGKVGALAARTFRYTAKNAADQTVTLAIHVVAAKDGCAALFVLGVPDKLAGREKELAALLESLRLEGQKPKRRAFGLGKKDPAAEPGAGGDGKPVPPAAEPGAAPAGEPVGKPGFTRIQGARELTWNGVAIDVPKDWRTEAGEDGTQLLLPPGFGASGVLEEIYGLCGDGSLRSLDAPDAVAKIQAALDELQPGLLPRGEARAAKFGALKGRTFVFTGANEAGQQVEARVHAFPAQNGVGGLLALGFPRALQARQATVDAMLGSLRSVAKAGGGGAVPAELAGQWIDMATLNANQGGSSRQRVLTLRADGTYTFAAESVSTNPNGAAWGSTNDAGRWTADATSITFRSQDGEVRTLSLAKRNHPKNKNDPMLVIDGTSFVTATQRAPW